MDPTDQAAYAKSYFRRTKSLPELKALADEVFNSATETVTINKTSDDGGSAEGIITFPKALLGLVIEELIAELEPAANPAPESVFYTDFSRRPVLT